ncbi:MAG TPA: response regulator [Polyangiaceae bacterium]|jgi:DNA-binding response OmpR family regulator
MNGNDNDEAQPSATPQREGLSGARADFVASLGRKVADARKTLAVLEGDPRAQPPRDELRRKLHALGTSARMMRFEAMAQALAEAEAALESIDPANVASLRNVATVAHALDDLPALAWSDSRRAEPIPAAPKPPATGTEQPKPAPPPDAEAEDIGAPMTALVVGPETIAEALLDGDEHRAVECERTEDAQHAVGLARAIAPDVVVLDALVPQAAELVEALADDPLTEPVPIVVVGKLSSEATARFVALGVARTLSSPYSGEALRNLCEEAVDQREGRTMRMSLGEPTIEQLGERLADEVRRAIVGAVDSSSRGKRVALGEGTEVMAAIWGAIARVREVVTTRTGGAVRFAGAGPEGSVALAFQPDAPASDRVRRGRGAAADVTLEGRRVVVADDDPGVTWFLADLLRTTGCTVHEALDGATALDLAMRTSPDVVISDILMPKMDGFALSRALRRDVALRDTPVILLSWKEDLLQRVRELGASAAAYLRKESDARSVLARVREVLWPRARVEARLKGTGEVRGRLDGLTVRSLLEFVATLRQDARVSVRDATGLYEIELRDGAPKRATRTAGDGDFMRGPKVLRELLGVSAGRFVVAPPTPGALQSELSGTLAAQLEKHIAAARGAIAVTGGPHATRIARLQLDEDVLHHYLRATPEPARTLVVRLAKGASPRTLLLEGQVVPSLLDDVLTDLAARGAVLGVEDEAGADVLTPAIESALGVLHGAPARNLAPLSPIRPSMTPPPIVAKSREDESSVNVSIEQILSEEPKPVSVRAAPKPDPIVPAPEIRKVSPRAEMETSLQVSVQQILDEEARVLAEERRQSQPSSLEDAVMQKLGETSPVPLGTHTSSPLPPPIVEPSALRPRSSNPPAEPRAEKTEVETLYEAQLATPSVPVIEPTPTPIALDETKTDEPPKLELHPEPETETGAETEPEAETETEAEAEAEPEPETAKPKRAVEVTPLAAVTHAPAPASGGALRWVLICAVLGLAAFVAVRISAGPAAPEPEPAAAQSAEAPINVLYTDLPPGAAVADGQGWLEVHAPEGTHVYVDGQELGQGAVSAGNHELSAGTRTKTVDVRAGKSTRVDWP